MNTDQIEGDWRVLKGKIKEQWGRLTDDHLEVLKGRLEMLAGRIQQAYGISMDDAERQVYEWRRSLEDTGPDQDADEEGVGSADKGKPSASAQSR